MKLAVFQYDIKWGDVDSNLEKIESCLVKESPDADLLVLPEMFSTGFSMDASSLAESMDGKTMSRVHSWAKRFNLAIAGSFIAKEAGCYYNRAFFITPQGETYTYDKRHLFSIGAEGETFTRGNSRVIVPYQGWNICLQVCYDLRFPVFSRNKENNYDILLYMANWPTARMLAWKILLPARAVENQAYVCGANRVGLDDFGHQQGGNSVVYNPKGKQILSFDETEESLKIIDLSYDYLQAFREKFPVWKDAD